MLLYASLCIHYKDQGLSKQLIVIAGPTAVGKTGICLQLAQQLGAEIFSADSRQVYKEMDIGTAKPSTEELQRVKHHFINHVSIHEDYDVGTYEREIIEQLHDYFTHKDNAILTGGTGLYLKAVMEGLDDFPEVAPEIADSFQKLYEDKGLDHLHYLLEKTDKAYFEEVDLNNHRRIIRALSVIESTGKTFSELRLGQRKKREFEIVPILLTRGRSELYDRINDRVNAMVGSGLIAEAKPLYPHAHLRALQTVGYSEIFLMMEGLVDQYTAIELIKRNTRRYAKRQLTWFRRDNYWQPVDAAQNNVMLVLLDLIASGQTMG